MAHESCDPVVMLGPNIDTSTTKNKTNKRSWENHVSGGGPKNAEERDSPGETGLEKGISSKCVLLFGYVSQLDFFFLSIFVFGRSLRRECQRG